MKRASAGGLIAVVVVITALGLAATSLPMRTCGTCEGQPPPQTLNPSQYRLGCPDCGDRGRVTLWRAWRPRVAEPVGQIVRILRNPMIARPKPILIPMLRQAGMDSSTYSGLWSEEGWIGRPRFVIAEGTPYLVLLARCSSSVLPGDSSAGALLIHPDGRALDCVQMTVSNRLAELTARYLDPPGLDGAQVAVLPHPGFFGNKVEPTLSYRLHQWHQAQREGAVPAKGAPETEGICRLKIVGDRFEVLAPTK